MAQDQPMTAEQLAARYDAPEPVEPLPPPGARAVVEGGTGQPPQPQVQSPSAPTTPAHPDWLVRQAEQLGFDPADLNVPTDQLGRMVGAAARALKSPVHNVPNPQQQQARAIQPPPLPPEPEPSFDLHEDTDPQIKKAFDVLLGEVKRLRAKAGELDQGLGDVRGRVVQTAQLTADTAIEAAFAQLPAWANHFGQGSAATIQPAQMQRRIAVLRSIGLKPGEVPNVHALTAAIRQNAELLFNVQPQSATPPQARGAYDLAGQSQPVQQERPRDPSTGRFTTDQWNAGALNRPSHRTGGGDEGQDSDQEATSRAVAAVAALLQ